MSAFSNIIQLQNEVDKVTLYISHSRFILFKLKIFDEIVTT